MSAPAKRKSSSGFVAILPLLILAIVVLAGIALVGRNNTPGVHVLGKSSEDEGSSGSDNSGSGGSSSGSSTSGSSGSGSGGSVESTGGLETTTPKTSGKVVKTEIKKVEKAEVKKPETEQENENESDNGNEVENETEVKVASSSGGFIAVKNKIGVKSSFPLAVNPETGELQVTTPSGVKVVTVLPDKAVSNLLTSHVLDTVTSESTKDATETIQLLEKDSKPVFEVQGEKEEKLLGLLPVKISKKVTVSADDGSVVAEQETLLNRILDLLSR